MLRKGQNMPCDKISGASSPSQPPEIIIFRMHINTHICTYIAVKTHF